MCKKLLFCLAVLISYQFLAGDSDVNNLAQALKTITKQPLSAEELEISTQKQRPFATHFLLIITDTSEEGYPNEDDVMIGNLAKAFKCNVPILTTEELAGALRRYKNKQKLPVNYRYFKIPSENTPRFLLCLPGNWDLSENALGIYVGKLEEITTKLITDKTYELSSAYDTPDDTTGELLKKTLSILFIPKKEYAGREVPRWIILFNGHGSQYEPYDTATILKTKKFLKKPGNVCGIDPDNFVEIVKNLIKTIDVALIDVDSCFFGGINMGYVLGKLGTINDTILTTHTITGDNCTWAKAPEYNYYWSYMWDIELSGPQDKTLHKINSALNSLMQETFGSLVRSIPGVKWPEKNYFSPTVEDGYLGIVSINSKTIRKQVNRPLSRPPLQGATFVIYVNTVPFALNTSGIVTSILSGIPGSTFHIFENISVLLPLVHPDGSLSRLFPLLTTKTPHVTKLFHIKKLACSNGTFELWVIKKPASYTALWVSQHDTGKKYIKIRWKNEKTGESATEISGEKADEWIKKFDSKIVELKKIAQAQAPYRCIENLGIETLPWN